MPTEAVEILAQMQGKSVDELIKERTETSDEELDEAVDEHLRELLNDDPENYDSRYERGEASSLNSKTYKQREITIEQFRDWYADKEREHLHESTFRSFANYLADEYAESTGKTRYWQLVSFIKSEFNRTVENQLREIDYTTIMKDDNDETAEGEGARRIESWEKDKMIDETDNPRLELTCRILWQTGLRASELANLRVEDIDLDEQKLTVETAKRDAHERKLSFNLRLKRELEKWLNAERHKYTQADDSPYLLPTHKSERIYPRNLTKAVRDLAEEAGIQEYNEFQNGGKRAEISPHSFRKAFGVQRLFDDDVRTAQLLLGHADISTTENYLDLDDEDLDYTPR